VASEVLDDILDWMLEGWMFGERESSLPVAGYVPSIERSRALRPIESKGAAASELAAKTLARVEAQREDDAKQRAAGAFRGAEQKLEDIQLGVATRTAVRKVLEGLRRCSRARKPGASTALPCLL
jgi:hypothetical protein